MPVQLLLVNPSEPRSRLHSPSMHRASGTRLPRPVNIPSPRSNTGEKNMSKKRSRRSSSAKKASPAQLAARARFTAMVKSGAFGKKKPKKAKKAASAKKRVAKKAARKSRPKHKKAHARKAHRRNDASFATDMLPKGKARKERAAKPLSAAAKKASAAMKAKPKKPKKAKAAPKESAEETAAFMAEAREGQKRTSRTPAQKKAAKARKAAKAKNKKQLFELKMGIAKTRAALAKEGKLPRLKKGEKRAGKVGAKRRILRAKKAALNLQRSSYSGGLSAADQKMLQASGLMKVSRANPGVGDIFKDLMTLAPQIGAHAVGLAGVAVAGQKLGTMLAEAVQGKEGTVLKAPPKDGVSGFVFNNAVTISSIAAAVAAYEAAKHLSPKSQPFAGALLMGGLAAAFVHAAARIQIKSKDDKNVETSKNLGRVLGLPLGPLAGFVDIGGRQLAVDGYGMLHGIGDYMALSGNSLTGSSLGDYMALSGNSLTGSSLGDYMALSGSTLTGSSLGEIGQMSEGRQGGRALNSPGDVPVEDFLEEDEDDEGSLSGSIFDD